MDFSVPMRGKKHGGVRQQRKSVECSHFGIRELIDPNDRATVSAGTVGKENAWNDMWDAMTEEEQDAYMNEFLEQNNKQKYCGKKKDIRKSVFFAPILKGGSKNEMISESN